jgi:hypothetical protein
MAADKPSSSSCPIVSRQLDIDNMQDMDNIHSVPIPRNVVLSVFDLHYKILINKSANIDKYIKNINDILSNFPQLANRDAIIEHNVQINTFIYLIASEWRLATELMTFIYNNVPNIYQDLFESSVTVTTLCGYDFNSLTNYAFQFKAIYLRPIEESGCNIKKTYNKIQMVYSGIFEKLDAVAKLRKDSLVNIIAALNK